MIAIPGAGLLQRRHVRLADGRRRRSAVLVCLCLGAVLPVGFAAPVIGQTATIVGRVADAETGRALSGVTVILPDASYQAMTDSAGRFVLTQLRPGTVLLEFRALGYRTRMESVALESPDIMELEVRLTASPINLPPITVTANAGSIAGWLASRGFSQRGFEGRALLHMTRQQLSSKPFMDLDDVLRNVPGVRVRRRVDQGSELLLEPDPRTGKGSCRIGVYLNGSNVELGRFTWIGVPGTRTDRERWLRDHPFERAPRPMRFEDLVGLRQVDGLELYGPNNNPVAPDSTCGTLMIWSSEMRPAVDEDLTGELHGRAVDERSGSVLEGVRVTIEGTGLSAHTDVNGAFAIPSLLPGEYRILAEYPGADPWTALIEVRAYGFVELELRLERRLDRWPGAGQER